MATNFFKVKKGLNVEPNTGSTVSTEGDVAYNSTSHQLEVQGASTAESITTASNTQTLTNKTFDAAGTGNTLSNVANTNVSASAAIARSKLATGTTNHVIINDGSTGAFSSEATLAKSRGGTGADNSSVTFPSSGTVQATTPNNHGVLVSGSGATATVIAPNASTAFPLVSGGASADPSWAKLSEAGGGTNQTTYTTGDILYASASNTLSKLGIGSANQVLKQVNGIPAWATQSNNGINYIVANPDAEVDTTGWSTYADAAQNTPVDATGGSPSSTWARSTSSPLRGSGSFLWTRTAANRQGEGVAYAFTIDAADKAKPLAITFDYSVASGTFFAADGTTAPLNDGTTSQNAGMSDLEVFIYDVTNSALIPVSPQVLTGSSSNSFTYKGVFQTASNSTSYRLVLHTARSTAVAFTMKFDNFFVGPQAVSYGSPMSDRASITPTFNGLGTVSGLNAYAWRNGDSLFVRGYVTAGTVAASTAYIQLPTGYTIDTTKFGSGTNLQGIGTYHQLISSSTNIYTSISGAIFYDGSTNNQVFFAQAEASGQFTKGNGSTIFTNSVPISFEFSVPIAGWSSTTLMSNDTDTRVVAFRASNNANQSTSTGVDTTVNLQTIATDTHSAFSSNTTYTAPVSGEYVLRATFAWAANSSGQRLIGYKKNGGSVVYIGGSFNWGGSLTTYATGTDRVKLVAGDTIVFTAFQDAGTLNILSGSCMASIERLSGPSAIAATENVSFMYGHSAATAVTSITTLPCDTKTYDTHNAVSSGVFTAPISGKYNFSASIEIKGATFSLNDVVQLDIVQAGSASVTRTQKVYVAAAVTQQVAQVNCNMLLIAGDTVQAKVTSARASSTLSGTVNENWFAGSRIGN